MTDIPEIKLGTNRYNNVKVISVDNSKGGKSEYIYSQLPYIQISTQIKKLDFKKLPTTNINVGVNINSKGEVQ